MPTTVCLAATCIHYPQQLWPYLNWARSLCKSRCGVISLESLEGDLTAGRLAVAQRTIRRRDSRLPEGEGLLHFETVQEAGAMLEAVQSDYSYHARPAREIAAQYFARVRVLTRVLEPVLA